MNLENKTYYKKLVKRTIIFPLVLGFSPAKRLIIESRTGYNFFPMEYKGTNLGLNLSYKIYSPTYLILSYTFHSNDGSSDEGIAMAKVE